MSILAPGNSILGVHVNDTDIEVGVVGTAAAVNNWPAAETPANAIDGVGQKYLNFAEEGSGFVVTPDASSTARSITFWTANDAEPRDPASFELYGTNMAGPPTGGMALDDYTLITSGPLALPSTRNAGGGAALDDANSQTVVFGNGTAYDHYLVVFTTVKDSAGANSVQIAEVQLSTIPEPSTAVLGALGLTFLAALKRPRRSSGV